MRTVGRRQQLACSYAALKEIDYRGGGLTAEGNGGDRNRLEENSEQMDQIIAYLKN
jgi:hypothetical protein